jgi:hypothetical protein
MEIIVMDKFAIDYNTLATRLEKKNKEFKLNDVKDRVVKVAYDVVKFIDDDAPEFANLWQIKQTPDGEIIVAMYNDDNTITASAEQKNKKNGWDAVLDRTKEAVHVFYNSEPIKKIVLDQVGISTSDAHLVCDVIKNKLASDKNTQQKLINDLSDKEKTELFSRYPELKF